MQRDAVGKFVKTKDPSEDSNDKKNLKRHKKNIAKDLTPNEKEFLDYFKAQTLSPRSRIKNIEAAIIGLMLELEDINCVDFLASSLIELKKARLCLGCQDNPT